MSAALARHRKQKASRSKESSGGENQSTSDAARTSLDARVNHLMELSVSLPQYE